MNTNLNSGIASPPTFPGEAWAAITGIIASALLIAKKLVSPKPVKPEPVSRAEFFTEMLATRERINATHLAILAALDSQASRLNSLEVGVARVDERTRKGGRTSS